MFRRAGSDEVFRGGVAIGDRVLDLAKLAGTSVLSGDAANACAAAAESTLNRFMAMGLPAWSALRLALSQALRASSPHESAVRACLIAQSDVEYAVPAHIGDRHPDDSDGCQSLFDIIDFDRAYHAFDLLHLLVTILFLSQPGLIR